MRGISRRWFRSKGERNDCVCDAAGERTRERKNEKWERKRGKH